MTGSFFWLDMSKKRRFAHTVDRNIYEISTFATALNRLGYVFELLIAHIDKVQINLAVDLLEQCAGEVNTAPFGDFLKARRDVYTVTVNIVPTR